MRSVTFTGLLQVAALLTVAFSLVTLLPVDHHSIQLFTHFRLQYLVGSLLLLTVFAFLRDRAYTTALAVSMLANATVVMPWYVDVAENSGESQLKLMSVNALSTNVEHDRLFALLSAEQPDLVFVQEISPQWEKALTAVHPDYPYRYAEAREGNFGIALLSRLPLARVDHVDSPPFGFPTLQGEVAIGDHTLRFVSTHPMVPLGASNFSARNEQLQQVAQQLGASSTSTILVGDLNASMWGLHYRRLESATGLRNARRGHGILPTWPTFMPFAMIPIDHVLVSSDIGVSRIETGPSIGSDHLPLIVTLSL
ncbi:MAG: endonuclease/exonuclease/phosphatase family protein [Woeseiaceae bacterium]|nr:endonuclease/exonuclease/phosphatase family protein [Woeseiaceae bacterium]